MASHLKYHHTHVTNPQLLAIHDITTFGNTSEYKKKSTMSTASSLDNDEDLNMNLIKNYRMINESTIEREEENHFTTGNPPNTSNNSSSSVISSIEKDNTASLLTSVPHIVESNRTNSSRQEIMTTGFDDDRFSSHERLAHFHSKTYF